MRVFLFNLFYLNDTQSNFKRNGDCSDEGMKEVSDGGDREMEE